MVEFFISSLAMVWKVYIDRGDMEEEAKVWELSQEAIETGQVDKGKVLNYLEKGSRNGEGDRFKGFLIVK